MGLKGGSNNRVELLTASRDSNRATMVDVSPVPNLRTLQYDIMGSYNCKATKLEETE